MLCSKHARLNATKSVLVIDEVDIPLLFFFSFFDILVVELVTLMRINASLF